MFHLRHVSHLDFVNIIHFCFSLGAGHVVLVTFYRNLSKKISYIRWREWNPCLRTSVVKNVLGSLASCHCRPTLRNFWFSWHFNRYFGFGFSLLIVIICRQLESTWNGYVNRIAKPWVNMFYFRRLNMESRYFVMDVLQILKILK